jgi:site-specific DNA-cytosine methylase
MRVIIVCEFSGIARDAFTLEGHDAASCDLLRTESPGKHYQQDCRELDYSNYDLLIAHPPCTYIASSGARWWKDRQQEQQEAIEFVKWLSERPVPRIAIENPIGRLSTVWRKPDQIIQPWQFGHGETKATCLWLKNLPLLQPTNIVDGRVPRVYHTPPSKDRWKLRSRTYEGIAQAMAQQWVK